ncbi:MAG: methylated-DNA--[protein]-cysteine S-methyltransferase [Parachlamydiaceae bacterium]|nr:methylated-DNA--[protein]-cysteine S-methyltransferase [Parachlamydiaceae bacterium]
MKVLKYKIIKSPVGHLKIVVNEKSLQAILWDNEKPSRVFLDHMVEDIRHPLILETEKQLSQYFLGQRKLFDVPLNTYGTDFQQDVWKKLLQIPYGVTWTYKDIAQKIKNPQAVRAVGSAIGRNPISIIIPCHRVIASNGSLAGFAGGLDRKKILLDLENIL